MGLEETTPQPKVVVDRAALALEGDEDRGRIDLDTHVKEQETAIVVAEQNQRYQGFVDPTHNFSPDGA